MSCPVTTPRHLCVSRRCTLPWKQSQKQSQSCNRRRRSVLPALIHARLQRTLSRRPCPVDTRPAVGTAPPYPSPPPRHPIPSQNRGCPGSMPSSAGRETQSGVWPVSIAPRCQQPERRLSTNLRLGGWCSARGQWRCRIGRRYGDGHAKRNESWPPIYPPPVLIPTARCDM